MKTSTVLAAISALDDARRALRCGDASIAQQMVIASACSLSSGRLREELLHEHPDVQVYRDDWQPFLPDPDPEIRA